MTNQLAIILTILIVAALGVDQFWMDGQGIMVLLRKFVELVEWVAFWR